MRGIRRWSEAFLMLLLVAFGATLYEAQNEKQPPPAPEEIRLAPRFALPDVRGGTGVYAGGEGPLLLMLTSSSCGECVRRGSLDRQAHELARSRGIPTWSILAWTGDEEAPAFLQTSGQTADRYLMDPDASVAIHRYGMDDRACWVLIDRKGTIVWQGPPDPEKLAEELRGLPMAEGCSPSGPSRMWHDS